MPFNGQYVLSVILFASQRGAGDVDLFRIVGKSPDELSSLGCQVETEAYNRLTGEMLKATGDPLLGLHAGEFMNLSAAGLILQIMQSSSTFGEALQGACDFSNLGCSHLPLHLEQNGSEVHIRIAKNPLWWEQDPVALRTTLDGLIAFNLRVIRTLTLNTHPEVRVDYGLPSPRNRQEYARVFGVPVRWDAGETALIMPASELSRPVISRDYELRRILVAHAREKLARLEQKQGFADRVRRTLLHLLNPGFPSIETVAANLNMSVRSLQRHLKEEGFTFRDLAEDLRHQFALAHLGKPELTVSEIAFQLGYADAAGFVRAFRKKTGKTPAVFRRESLVK